MIKLYNSISFRFFFILSLLSFTNLFAQSNLISGPIEVCAGEYHVYRVWDFGGNRYIPPGATWQILSGSGTITNASGPSARVTWNSGPGILKCNWQVEGGEGTYDNYSVTLNVTVSQTSSKCSGSSANEVWITGRSSVCAGQSYSYATLMQGSWATFSSGTWTILSGSGTISNQNTIECQVIWNSGPGVLKYVGQSYDEDGNPYPAETRTIAVNVNPTPSASFVSPTSSACLNVSKTFTTQSGMGNYQWSFSGGGTLVAGGSALDNTATIVWNTIGPKTIYVSYSNGCNTSTASQNITVSATPVPSFTTASATSCIGSSGNVFATENGMSNYIWSIPSGATVTSGGGSGDNSVTITWTSSGSKQVGVIYTNPAGCVASATSYYTTNVIPAPSPTITGLASVCKGSSEVIYSTEAGMSNYSWSVSAGGSYTGSGNSIIVNWNTSGAQSVSVTYSQSGCSSGSPTIKAVDVKSIPVSSFIEESTSLCAETVGTFSTQTGFSNYVWTIPPEAIIISGGGTTNASISLKWVDGIQTSIKVRYSNGNGCTSADIISNVNVKPHIRDFSVISLPACADASESAIALGGSDVGVNYQLLNGGTANGPIKAGTGEVLTWDNISSGNYSVIATHATNLCAKAMGETQLELKPLPLIFETIAPINFCEHQFASLSISGSEVGTNYTLYKNGSVLSENKTGDGSSLTWSSLTEGTYFVQANRANCLNDFASKTIEKLPSANNFTVSGGGVIRNAESKSVTLSSSQSGINYQLQKDNQAFGNLMTGNNSALAWSQLTENGNYSVNAISPNGCQRTMEGGASIIIEEIEFALNTMAYLYKHDEHKRVIAEKIPGADWRYIVYDNQDRIVMTQDGEQRKTNQWAYIKYDNMNRPVITGIYTHSSLIDQSQMTEIVTESPLNESYNGNSTTHGYTNNVFSNPSFTQNFEVLTVTYYDNYDFREILTDIKFNYLNSELTSQYQFEDGKNFPWVSGQVTGTKTKILETNSFLWTVTYFDDKDRTVQVVSENHTGGINRSSQVFDFLGRPTHSRNSHTLGLNGNVSTERKYEYDYAGRLTRLWHKVNNSPFILLTQNEYNEIGQLIDKKIYKDPNTNTFKQSVDYRYNIRGWLTSINNSALSNDGITNDDTDDVFGMNLAYEKDLPGVSSINDVQYNGNVSAMSWSSNAGISTVKERGYKFSYDPLLNRISSAESKLKVPAWNSSQAFGEGEIQYDLNGNIKTLSRTGSTPAKIDQLTYAYQGNQLLKVTDAADAAKGFIDGSNTDNDYGYDGNGNMNVDKNKGISSILYNHLNLPKKVIKSSGESVVYTYEATGIKLRQQVLDANQSVVKTTDYVGEGIYENDLIQFLNHEEGRVILTSDPEYQLNLKDHLGSSRMTLTTANVIEEGTATLETANVIDEQNLFLYYDEAVKVNHYIFDHTQDQIDPLPEGATNYATRLTGGNTSSVYGLARSISVMPGDIITAEVWAKYLDTNSDNWNSLLDNFMNSIQPGGGAASGTLIDGGLAGSLGGFTFPFLGFLTKEEENEDGPKAYINYLLFDRDYQFISGDFKKLSSNPKENGNNVAHEQLSFKDNEAIHITEPGYIYIYLSNENDTPVEVYFDDFKVTHTKSPIIQTNDYYPFGLSFNDYRREHSTKNNYLYGGKELQDNLGIGSYDYGARTYLPEIARWTTIDPLLENRNWLSPYNFVQNNPINRIDPTGKLDEPPSTEVQKNSNGTYTVVNAKADNDNNVYVVDSNGNRTGEIIATTLTPIVFMSTNDRTGELTFDKTMSGVTFDLNDLTVSGTVSPNANTTSTISKADATQLVQWGKELFQKELNKQSPLTFYGRLEVLKKMSANGEALDFKVSLGANMYTALKAGTTQDGKPVITTLRAVGNVTFGANMHSTAPAILTDAYYYKNVMEKVGEYNQTHNGGNGYNSGHPYYGEHTYSGSFIYYGYWGEFYNGK